MLACSTGCTTIWPNKNKCKKYFTCNVQCYLYSLLQQPVLALQRGPAVSGGQPLQRLPDVHLVRGLVLARRVGAGEALADGELQQHLLLVIVLPVQPPRVLATNSQSVLEYRVLEL